MRISTEEKITFHSYREGTQRLKVRDLLFPVLPDLAVNVQDLCEQLSARHNEPFHRGTVSSICSRLYRQGEILRKKATGGYIYWGQDGVTVNSQMELGSSRPSERVINAPRTYPEILEGKSFLARLGQALDGTGSGRVIVAGELGEMDSPPPEEASPRPSKLDDVDALLYGDEEPGVEITGSSPEWEIGITGEIIPLVEPVHFINTVGPDINREPGPFPHTASRDDIDASEVPSGSSESEDYFSELEGFPADPEPPYLQSHRCMEQRGVPQDAQMVDSTATNEDPGGALESVFVEGIGFEGDWDEMEEHLKAAIPHIAYYSRKISAYLEDTVRIRQEVQDTKQGLERFQRWVKKHPSLKSDFQEKIDSNLAKVDVQRASLDETWKTRKSLADALEANLKVLTQKGVLLGIVAQSKV